jgi:two-component system response regulator DesR
MTVKEECAGPPGENSSSSLWSAEKDPLTDRERLILRRAGDGETTAELAHSLRLTEGTVRNYLSEAISQVARFQPV